MNPNLTLTTTAFNQQQLIDPDVPQVALAGRSNVGKSSLVNALAGRKQLAKTSATPGKTRSVNYYRIEISSPAYLVDLPGYGYARCSKEERLQWAKLLENYFRNTQGLVGLAVLLDSRLLPQKLDKELIGFAQSISLPVLPILTKSDKPKIKDLEACLAAWHEEIGADVQYIITSSEKKKGIDTAWSALLGMLSIKV